MLHRHRFIPPLLIILVSVVIIIVLYLLKPTAKVRPEPVPNPLLVKVTEASPHSRQVNIQSQGAVAPRREINLVAEVSGRVISVADNFVNGGFFSANEPLIRLDDRDYRYALVTAEAQVAEREKTQAIERGQARQAKREWRDLDNDEANNLFLRKPQVAAAKAHVLAAIAQRDQATLNLARTNISLPFSGRVRSTSVDIGQYVSPNTVIAVVYDRALAEVRLPLTNEEIALIGLPLGSAIDTSNQPEVTLSAVIAGQRHQWQAHITRTEASVDTGTRFHFAVAEVIEPFNTAIHSLPLVMGLFVDAQIAGRSIDHVFSVPKKAVLRENMLQENSVFIVDDNHLLQRRPMRVIDKDDRKIWFTGDIKTGEKIVVSDANVLTDGVRVTSTIE